MIKNTLQARKEKLLETGVYSIGDLEINYQKNLSVRQKRMLLGFSFLWFGLAALNIVAIIFLIYFYLMYLRSFMILVIGIALCSLNIFLSIQHATPFWKDAQEDLVKTASGEITKKAVYHGTGGKTPGNSYFTVRVGSIVFSVSPLLYYSLEDNKGYRLFYVPNSKRVINVDTY